MIDEPGLWVPHPRFRERLFVLRPLASVAPGMVDPVTGLTVENLLKRLGWVTPIRRSPQGRIPACLNVRAYS